MIKHAKTSAKTDTGGVQVGPDEWNADHPAPYLEILMGPALNFTAATMTSAVTEVSNTLRRPNRLIDPVQTGYTQVRVCTYLSAAAGASTNTFAIQWSSDSTNWFYLDGTAGPNVQVGNTTGVKIGSWVTISGVPNSAVVLRVVKLSGDDTNSVTYTTFYVQFK